MSRPGNFEEVRRYAARGCAARSERPAYLQVRGVDAHVDGVAEIARAGQAALRVASTQSLVPYLLTFGRRFFDNLREARGAPSAPTSGAFNKTVVTRYCISLEHRHYASTTINLRLAAVRRLAYEAADRGLLSADLAAGIRRVKGAKRLGVPIGNWLTAEQGKHLLLTADSESLRGKRDYATLSQESLIRHAASH